MIAQTRRDPLSAGGLLIADGIGSGMPIEPGPRVPQAAELIPAAYTLPGPVPLSALTIQCPYPVVVGLRRTDLRVPRNREFARAVAEAEETAMIAMANRHQWRMVTMLRLQPGADESTDPIEHLLEQVRIQGADAVVVPERRHLSDMAGHDGLERVCRVCFVATMSEQQLWPCTVGSAAVPTRPMS